MGDIVNVTFYDNHRGDHPTQMEGIVVRVPPEGKWCEVEIDGRRDNYPWNRLSKGEDDKWARILMQKQETSLQELCADLPMEFIKYFKYCRRLEYGQAPDYDMLRGLLRSAGK